MCRYANYLDLAVFGVYYFVNYLLQDFYIF